MVYNFSKFRKELFDKIDKKNSWGKNEIKTLFDNTFFEQEQIETDWEKPGKGG